MAKNKKLLKQVRLNEDVVSCLIEKEEDSECNNGNDFEFISLSDISDNG